MASTFLIFFCPISGKYKGQTMRNLSLSVIFLFALFLTACGPGNTVKLLPPPPIAASSLPPPSAPTVSVVNFKDERSNPTVVGIRRDGSDFTTTGNVATWISRALADELARKGFRVTFANEVQQARNSNPVYLVTGAVKEVWLKENSATELSVQMRISCTLANKAGKLWTESSNTSQTKTSLPSDDNADKLLLSTLNDLIAPIANKIVQTANNKK